MQKSKISDFKKLILENISKSDFLVDFEEITDYIGSLKGKIELTNGSTLYFFEFVEIQNNIPVLVRYKYQWQSSEGELLNRWDNAPHHRELSTFPDHFHDQNGVYPSPAMNLESILDKSLSLE